MFCKVDVYDFHVQLLFLIEDIHSFAFFPQEENAHKQ